VNASVIKIETFKSPACLASFYIFRLYYLMLLQPLSDRKVIMQSGNHVLAKPKNTKIGECKPERTLVRNQLFETKCCEFTTCLTLEHRGHQKKGLDKISLSAGNISRTGFMSSTVREPS
jgi:hypothetical protein